MKIWKEKDKKLGCLPCDAYLVIVTEAWESVLINNATFLSLSLILVVPAFKDVHTLTTDCILWETIPFVNNPCTEEIIPLHGPVSRFVQF